MHNRKKHNYINVITIQYLFGMLIWKLANKIFNTTENSDTIQIEDTF